MRVQLVTAWSAAAGSSPELGRAPNSTVAHGLEKFSRDHKPALPIVFAAIN
ncbi:hypothetical protein [Nocardia sp. X0981]